MSPSKFWLKWLLKDEAARQIMLSRLAAPI